MCPASELAVPVTQESKALLYKPLVATVSLVELLALSSHFGFFLNGMLSILKLALPFMVDWPEFLLQISFYWLQLAVYFLDSLNGDSITLMSSRIFVDTNSSCFITVLGKSFSQINRSTWSFCKSKFITSRLSAYVKCSVLISYSL